MTDPHAPDFADILAAFFADVEDPEMETDRLMVDFDCPPPEESGIEAAQPLIPAGKLAPDDIEVRFSGIEQAPFLILTRANTKNDQGEAVRFMTRRVAMHGESEQAIRTWIDKFTGVDAVLQEQAEGNHAYMWPLPERSGLVQDGFRLYVARAQNMMLLDRITTFRPR